MEVSAIAAIRVKKSVLLLVGFAAAVAIVFFTVSGIRYARIKHRLRSVRIGMSRTEVLALVGKPQSTKMVGTGLGTNAEIWFFPHKHAESENPRCVFGGTNGTV